MAIDYGTNDITTSGIGYFGGLVLSGGSGFITNSMVATGAAIDSTKLKHRFNKTYAQPNTTATTERKTIHTVDVAQTIVSFRAGSVVANGGAATVSIRLKKNGTNIDTAALVLDNTNTAFIFRNAAGFTSTTLVASDVVEVDITATAGGGTLATGVFCELVVKDT